ncbi:MAG: T9SS type A sorting domain-containing protein [bacterium]
MKHTFIIGMILLAATVARAQISSSAFDPNCYFPRIGVPGEIDTIYGAKALEGLGSYLLNLGPNPENSAGKVMWFEGEANIPIYKSWPSFNIHKLQSEGRLNEPYIEFRRGHFHSPKYLDILAQDGGRQNPARIYWQDDQGNYDSGRFTVLASRMKAKLRNDYSFMNPFIGKLTSDTLDDVLNSVWINNRSSTGDSVYLLYYNSDNLKSQRDTVFADSTVFFDTLQPNASASRSLRQGDFRGVGRQDLLAFDDIQKIGVSNDNIFYYRNDTPFTLSKLLYALKYDTIFTQRENPNSELTFSTLAMHTLPKPAGDSSDDLVLSFATQYATRPTQAIQEFRFFRGGKDFGSHRLTADSAAFVLHEPYYYDLNFHSMAFGYGLKDCGYMTGTRNRILFIEGLLDQGFFGYEYFYVLGDAIDDKVDMFIGPIPNGGGAGNQVDTIVADNDNLQDIIMGESGFGMDAADAHGSIFVVHGSNKIPERTRNAVTIHEVEESPNHLIAYPNPCDQHTVLTFDNSTASAMDVTVVSSNGVIVQRERTPSVNGMQQFAIDLSTQAAGNYIITLTSPADKSQRSINIVKTGGAVKPWTLNLKGMVGR